MHRFDCNYRCTCGTYVDWIASWELIGAGDYTERIRVHEGNKSYVVIIAHGDHTDSDLIIVPSLGVGVEIEDYTDLKHIECRLGEHARLSRHKAVTIANAIKDFFS